MARNKKVAKRRKVELPKTNILEGQYGVVKTVTDLVDDGGREVVVNRAQRFSEASELVAEFDVISGICNTWERLIITLHIETKDLKIPVTMDLINCNFNDPAYRFSGGSYGYDDSLNTLALPLTADRYIKIRGKIIEMCNPHNPYEINKIIDILRGSPDVDIRKWVRGVDKHTAKRPRIFRDKK